MMCCSLCKLMSFPRVAVMVSLSRDSRERPEGASREKRSKMRLINTQIKLCCKETLGNACVNWLLMLYYKCRSRNGLGSPFEGRKYSGSRIREEAAVYVESPVISLIPARNVPS